MAASRIITLRIPFNLLEKLDYLAEVNYPSRKPDIKGNRSQVILDAVQSYLIDNPQLVVVDDYQGEETDDSV